jgi:hypothetical protein
MDADEPGTALSRFPSLARAQDGRVALAWDDDRAGLEDVYMRVRSAGERPQWGPEIRVSSPTPKLADRAHSHVDVLETGAIVVPREGDPPVLGSCETGEA